MSFENDQITDSELHAFLDNQLSDNEKNRILNLINTDTLLEKRLTELRRLRDMYQHAYDDVPKRKVSLPPQRKLLANSKIVSLVASILVIVGGLLGWVSHMELVQYESSSAENTAYLQTPDQTSLQSEIKNVILHITSGEPDRLEAALDDAEHLLSTYRHNKQPLRLEIIANDTGLNLMRTDVSIYQDRIRKLVTEYNNVRFLACSRAIKRLESQGVNVELLPEIQIAPSAMEQIIQRMQAGWQYIKA